MAVSCLVFVLLCALLQVIGFTVYAEWNTKHFLKREHTLIRPYQSAGMTVPHWDFLGSTMVTNVYIRLTPEMKSKNGAIWSNVKCVVPNWEMHVNFKIHGLGKKLYGDGLAFWYTKDQMKTGPVFGSMNDFVGLGVFLDTYSNHNGPHNHKHPYISAMVSNGSLKYDHDTDGTHTEIAGCEALFRNKNYDTHMAIRYENNTLKVSVDTENKNTWRECFTVAGIRLPIGYYFGLSAATGELFDNHDVISVKFYELDSGMKDAIIFNGLPEASRMEAPREHIEVVRGDTGLLTGWKLFTIIILIIIGLMVIAVVGFIVFQKQMEVSRKRFY